MPLYLGIDTSNYTTSAALYDSDTGEMLQQKKLLPVKKGSLGLRQSDAVFHHTQQLHTLVESLMKGIQKPVEAVGVSTRPRPVEGSYMPCFTVGENAAGILSSVLKIPLHTFSHQEGHIAAALFSAGKTELLNDKFLAFHVSGGTTEALFVSQNEQKKMEISLAAQTLDLNAGQAVDRVGLMLGLDFPCGSALEELARGWQEPISVKPVLKGFDCCLSGVENLCKSKLEAGCSKAFAARYCLEYIKETLYQMARRLLEQYGDVPLVFAGGVMSNTIIRKEFETRLQAYFAEPAFSADNSAGIAYLTWREEL